MYKRVDIYELADEVISSYVTAETNKENVLIRMRRDRAFHVSYRTETRIVDIKHYDFD